MKKIGMLGSGAWGTAMANLLAENGHEVHLWCYEKDVSHCIAQRHVNERYLPDIKLSSFIMPTTSLEEVLRDTQIIFEAIPVAYMRSVFELVMPHVNRHHRFVVLSKGLEQDTLMLPSQIIADVLGAPTPIVGVAGPSFAHDVASKSVTALTVAGLDCDLVHEIQQLIQNHYCCTYCCTDLIGVQCGGAFKNILALGLGILDGSGYTDNTKAFVFTRGLYEMAICAQALGGKKETLYGLSGVGDLVLTCMGRLSRNTYLGQCLGKGKSIDEGTKELGTIPEGMNTIESVYQLAQRNKLDLPVCAGIRAMVLKSMNVQEFLEDIIAHHAAAECL